MTIACKCVIICKCALAVTCTHVAMHPVLGVTIVTPIRNDRGRFRSPHANVLGRLVPNCLPTRRKAEMRPWVDQTSVAHHGGIREVILEHAEEKARSTVQTRFVHIHNIIIVIMILFAFLKHSSRRTAVTVAVEV